MKKNILILMVTLPILGLSQTVVYDPTQAANMGTQIQNSATQVAQLDKSLEYMQKASEKLDKVSGYVRDLQDLKEIADMSRESFRIAQQLRANLPKVKSQSRRQLYTKKITQSLKSINESLAFVNKVVSNNFFSMSDKDRMELIKRERHRVHISRTKLVGLSL
ncbi:hypothetical protein [Riemerella anatipestifer]|uniref:hypothetical protein n=1 Tax=Riemerella anatipestifer TaxID=34085 RepID=UPI00129D4B43|nr:hypothetical protein [Riemerella anatipestifer]MRM84275.1 hypothetical protein [Riemerella anatipestifer]